MIYLLLLVLPLACLFILIVTAFFAFSFIPRRMEIIYHAHLDENQVAGVKWAGSIAFIALVVLFFWQFSAWADRTRLFGPTESQTLGSIVFLPIFYLAPYLAALLGTWLMQFIYLRWFVNKSSKEFQ